MCVVYVCGVCVCVCVGGKEGERVGRVGKREREREGGRETVRE